MSVEYFPSGMAFGTSPYILCGTESLLIHSTVSPFNTLTDAGVKVPFCMVTVTVFCDPNKAVSAGTITVGVTTGNSDGIVALDVAFCASLIPAYPIAENVLSKTVRITIPLLIFFPAYYSILTVTKLSRGSKYGTVTLS